MGIGSFFGRLLGIAQTVAPIAGLFFPAFMPLISVSLRAIIAAEGKFPAAKSGADKAAWAADVVSVNAPDMIAAIEAATGKQLVDEALLQDSLKNINDGLVKAMNAFRVLPKRDA
ncbi:MAG: hypothetical protein WCP82_07950 [Alphaproteobacteria bacterium]